MVEINKPHRICSPKYPKGHLKIAVIGGNGFIGEHLIKKLAYSYTNLIICSLDPRPYGTVIDTYNSPSLVQQVTLDTALGDTVHTWFRTEQPDIVIFLAGHEAPTVGWSSAVADTRALLGLSNVVELLADFVPDYFMYISSAAVYGDQGKRIVSEDSKLKPTNFVGFNKMAAEQQVTDMCERLGVAYSILRPSEVYGRHRYETLAVKSSWPGYVGYYIEKYLQAVEWKTGLAKKPVEDPYDFRMNFSSSVYLDFVHVDFVVDVITSLCQKRQSGVYNVGSGTVFTLGQLVELIAPLAWTSQLSLLPDGVEKKQLPLLVENKTVIKPHNSLIQSTKIHELVPYAQNNYSLVESLSDLIEVRAIERRVRLNYEKAMDEGLLVNTTGRRLYTKKPWDKKDEFTQPND